MSFIVGFLLGILGFIVGVWIMGVFNNKIEKLLLPMNFYPPAIYKCSKCLQHEINEGGES